MPWITLWTDPIVDIEVEVPGLQVGGPEETLELCDNGIGSEHIEAEHEADGIGPVHLVGMGEVEWGSTMCIISFISHGSEASRDWLETL